MNAANTLKKLGIEQTFNYIYKDPDKNMNKIMDWADKFSQGQFSSQREMIREAIENPEHPYYSYIRKLFKDVDPHVTKTLAVNFFINAALTGWPKKKNYAKSIIVIFLGQFFLIQLLPVTALYRMLGADMGIN